MDTRTLQTFLRVRDLGSFTKAAAELGYAYTDAAPFDAVVIGSLTLSQALRFREETVFAALAAGIRGEVRDINFGNQIRSYVLQPYTMVKDHRTDCEVGNAGAVLDGGLQPFINAYLKWQATAQK